MTINDPEPTIHTSPRKLPFQPPTLRPQVLLHPPVIIRYNQQFCFRRHQPTRTTTTTTVISLSLPQLQGVEGKGNMNTWLLVLFSFSVPFLIKPIYNFFFPSDKLPPGPSKLQAIGTILWLILTFITRRHRRSRSPPNFEPFLRSLRAKFGPMFTLYIGSRPTIFIADRFLAHQALIQNGAVFSDRPPAVAGNKIATSNQHTINSAFYGPTWRVLRRNLTSEILHPSRMKSYSHTRKWVLKVLLDRLEEQSKSGGTVRVMDHFQYAMFCLLVYMCFGDRLDHKQIEEIEGVQRRMLVKFAIFNRINLWPRLMKVLFRRRWELFLQLRKDQEDVLIPLIRARKMVKEERLARAKEDKDEFVISYVDTLLDLQLPDEKRKLEEGEMVSLCSEFLSAGTDTTSTALQWIMANLVKYPEIQEKLFSEIKGVVAEEEEEVQEEDLQKMPYLRAIILEGLRRHPPGHFVLPHAVTEDVVLDKYVVPKNGTINFMVAEIGWDPEVWEDPMVFKPERFLSSEGEAFDITGSREIKMMPFGVGRRICPGSSLAMLHLEYFVANLVRNYEWKAVDGHIVDLSEKQEFTTVMKNPLQAHVVPRLKTQLPVV